MAREALGDGGPRGLPLSTGYRAGDFVYVSGQIAFGANGRLAPGGIASETAQTLNNIAAALTLGGASLADVVKVTVFLADLDDFAEFNAVYRTYFPQSPPARTTVQAGLMLGARVEIEAVAYRPL